MFWDIPGEEILSKILTKMSVISRLGSSIRIISETFHFFGPFRSRFLVKNYLVNFRKYVFARPQLMTVGLTTSLCGSLAWCSASGLVGKKTLDF